MSDLRMPDLNKVILAGNLTRDPELRHLPSGMSVCTLGLAANRKYKTKDGDQREDTLFINVKCWGKTAEFVGETFHKGRAVLVEGRLQMREWDDEASGQRRSVIEINADRVQSLSWDDKPGSPVAAGRSKSQESEDVQEQDGLPF